MSAMSEKITEGNHSHVYHLETWGRVRRFVLLKINYSVMILLAIFFLFPIVFMIVSSFKPEKVIFDDLKTFTWAFIPREITFTMERKLYCSINDYRDLHCTTGYTRCALVGTCQRIPLV